MRGAVCGERYCSSLVERELDSVVRVIAAVALNDGGYSAIGVIAAVW